MKILLTGATGFIGKELVTFLADKGHQLNIVVRRCSNKTIDSRVSVTQIQDISAATNWQTALEGCEVVIHSAARTHIINEKDQDPLAAFRSINVEGTLQLARSAILAGVKRFIFISSLHVNGNKTTESPFTEEQTPVPNTDYAISKLEAEDGLRALSKDSSMELVIIRPPLVYGENAPGNFGRLVNLVSKGIPLPLASVKNKRSFIARQNLIDFIAHCVDHPKAANETFLIADSDDISTPDLIRLLAQSMKKPARLIPFPTFLLKFGATLIRHQSIYQQLCGCLQVDSSKAQQLLDWKAPFKMSEALDRVSQKDRHSAQST